MGAARAADRRCPVPQLNPPSHLATAGSRARLRARLVAGAGHPVRQGAHGHPSFRMRARRPVASRARGWNAGDRMPGRQLGYAWAVDPARLDRGKRPVAARVPALCINRGEPGRPGSLSGAQRATFHTGFPGFLTAAGPAGPGGSMTTDRLVTPFMCLRAQSGPRMLSPMNFSRGSRSTQRLLVARPSDFRSRGRA